MPSSDWLILFFCWWNDSSYDWTAVCFAECRILVIRIRIFFLRFLYINSDHNLIRLQGRLHISALSKFALTYGCFRIPHTPWALQGFSHQAGHVYWRLGEVYITTRGLSPPFLCEQMTVTVLERPTPLPSIVRRNLQLKVLIWRFRSIFQRRHISQSNKRKTDHRLPYDAHLPTLTKIDSIIRW